MPESISVIISTYENPRALHLVLTGLARQTQPPDELLIADDGSGPQTRALIDEWAARLPYPVRHVWHPDEGFRKCRILNRAIAAAAGTYLVFFDGDCVPSAHCLAVHAACAAPDRYIAGGKVMLGARLSAALTERDIAGGLLDGVGWWWLGVEKRHRLIAGRIPGLRDALDRRVKRKSGWRGENSSAWAAHVRAVGGFDERFTYGYEDADFGHRMQLSGLTSQSVRYTAPVYHLDHPRPWRTEAVVTANRALYDANRAARVIVTPHGLGAEAIGAGSSRA